MGHFAYMSAVAAEMKQHFKQWIPNIAQYTKLDFTGSDCAFYYSIDVHALHSEDIHGSVSDTIGDLLEALANLSIDKIGIYEIEVYRNCDKSLVLCVNL